MVNLECVALFELKISVCLSSAAVVEWKWVVVLIDDPTNRSNAHSRATNNRYKEHSISSDIPQRSIVTCWSYFSPSLWPIECNWISKWNGDGTLNCHHYYLSISCEICHIIYQMSYNTCSSRIFPSSLPLPAFCYYIGARDDEAWWHLQVMPLIIDDYATTWRCCGQKGERWYNGRYVNTRSITSTKTRRNRKNAENLFRDYIIGRVGHYLMALEMLCDAAEICLYGGMSLLCLSTACI